MPPTIIFLLLLLASYVYHPCCGSHSIERRRKRLLDAYALFVHKESYSFRMTTAANTDGPNQHRETPITFVPDEIGRLVKYLSALTMAENLPLDLIVIGACDSRTDEVIWKFFKMRHWRGVFIEPNFENFNKTKSAFIKHNITAERAFLIHAAVSNKCSKQGDIFIYSPVLQKGIHHPHYVRQQLHTVEKNIADKYSASLSLDAFSKSTVPCISIREVLQKSQQHFYNQQKTTLFSHDYHAEPENIDFLPHLIKIDTEGHDGVIVNMYLDYISTQMEESSSGWNNADVDNSTSGSSSSDSSDSVGNHVDFDGTRCIHYPLLIYFEQDKLSTAAKHQLQEKWLGLKYLSHRDIFIGHDFNGQNMYIAPNASSTMYSRACNISIKGNIGGDTFLPDYKE